MGGELRYGRTMGVSALSEEDVITTLAELDLFYQCPKSPEGKRLGPLVAYRGEYEPGMRYVGDGYVNLRLLCEELTALSEIAERVKFLVVYGDNTFEYDYVVGMPMSGLPFAQELAHSLEARYNFLEKKGDDLVLGVSLTTPSGSPAKVIIGEELCNNFASTAKAVAAIEAAGGEVVAIATIFNRSERTDWNGIPVIAAVNRPMPEYRQDDPAVAEDIQAGNVEWSPKSPPENWERLKEIMSKASEEGGQ